MEDVFGLTCLIDEPTRITESSKTLIDVILNNNPRLFTKSGVFNPEISDHSLVYTQMVKNAIVYPSSVITFRSYKNFNEDDFRQALGMSVNCLSQLIINTIIGVNCLKPSYMTTPLLKR